MPVRNRLEITLRVRDITKRRSVKEIGYKQYSLMNLHRGALFFIHVTMYFHSHNP